jgi:serine/threonine protein kinase
MAPEVSLNENYSLSADLYSFSILFWEVLTLRKAFAYLPADEHRERVIKNDERPELDPHWTPGIKDLLVGCWARNPFQRPTARDAHKSTRAEIQALYVDEFRRGCVIPPESNIGVRAGSGVGLSAAASLAAVEPLR